MSDRVRGTFPSYEFRFDYDHPFGGDYENPTDFPAGCPPRYPPATAHFSIQSRYTNKMLDITEIEDLRLVSCPI